MRRQDPKEMLERRVKHLKRVRGYHEKTNYYEKRKAARKEKRRASKESGS